MGRRYLVLSIATLLGCSPHSARTTSDANADGGTAGTTSTSAATEASRGGTATTTSPAAGDSGGARGSIAGRSEGTADAGSGGRANGSGGRSDAGNGGGAGSGGSNVAGLGGGTSGASAAAGVSAGAGSGAGGGMSSSHIAHVFVISLENHDEGSIVGNSSDAPYINGELLKKYAHSTNFVDRLALGVPSEPHYVWMEAGTNAFSDHTFTTDDDASGGNSTKSTAHLSTQLDAKGLRWMSYQESIDGTSGACPIASSGHYATKHDPFVFFQDVSGNPPSKTNTRCRDHHKEYSALAGDLMHGTAANYTFITPNLCHDMHGDTGCPNGNTIRAGDDWLRANVPPLLTYCDANDGVIFLVWDEGENTQKIPFLALGKRVKSGYASAVELDHGSLAKSVEVIFGLPVLDKVKASNDFGDLFQTGQFP